MRTRTLTLLLTLPAALAAQIPNGDFEVWNDMGGYLDPADWATWNYLTEPIGFVTCTQGSPGYSGLYYMHLEAGMVGDPYAVGLSGLDLGAVACKGIESVLLPSIGQRYGFPFTQRPGYITGAVRHHTSIRLFVVELTRWTGVSREVVATKGRLFMDDQPNWTVFQEPLTYYSESSPDSAWIHIGIESSNIPGEFLDVDALGFEGSVGLDESAADRALVTLSPSPCATTLRIDLNGEQARNVSLWDATGRIMNEALPRTTESVDISGLAPGPYSIRVVFADGRVGQSRFLKE